MKTDFHALLILSPESRNHPQLLREAKAALAKQAKLSVLYIVPPAPVAAHQLSDAASEPGIHEKIAHAVLEEVGIHLGLPADHLLLAKGSVQQVTKQIIQQIKPNLIIAELANTSHLACTSSS